MCKNHKECQGKNLAQQFTEDCNRIPTPHKELLTGCEKSQCLRDVEHCYAQASGLARYFQKQYRRALKAFSAFSVLLVMFYLIYDEGGLIGMLPCYGLVLILYYALHRMIDNGSIHTKYIQYRLLAETLRVQTYLLALGVTENIGRQFTWTQKQDTQWIVQTIDRFLGANPTHAIGHDVIREAWIDDQLRYHRSAWEREKKQHDRAERISRWMIACTVILFLVILLVEYCIPTICGQMVLNFPLGIWLKLLWGSISAVTLFVSTYYGLQSLERKMTDHEKMVGLFEEAARRYDAEPDCHIELFRELAREEIIESGNWMSYSQENRPTFSL